MANKKSKGKKKTTSQKSVTKKKNVKEEHEKIIESVSEFDTDYKKVILIGGITIIVFCLFYFITVFVTGRDTQKTTNTSTTTSISYAEIMAGRSFSMPEAEYLVIYYDRSDSDLLSTFSSDLMNYRSLEDHYAIYTVDMSDAMNSKYASEESNWSPSSVAELSINGPTLIHFRDGKVVEYFEGEEDVHNYLNK